MKPTPEQEDAVAKFSTCEPIKINAYAGTGKTSTLTFLANATPRMGTYLAFNKSIADEARKKFPQTIACMTGHSLAFRATVAEFGVPKMTGNLNGGIVAAKMNYRGRDVRAGGALVMQLSPRNWGYLVSETVKKWMRSDRDEIDTRDVPLDGKLAKLEDALRKPIVDDVARDAGKLWQKMIDRSSDVPLSHDGYLKVYGLRRPFIDGDFVMLDEAQDTNGIMMGIMRNQRSQLVCVGDRWQQIYAWRGAENAMVELPSKHEARLSTSFRFGTEIADYASQALALLGETIPLKGNPARESRVGAIDAPRTILCRTNGRIIETAFNLVAQRKRPHIIGGIDELMAWVKAAESLMQGRAVERPIELFGFTSWDDVRLIAEIDQDPDLQRWVKLIDTYGCDKLRQTLERLPKSEDGADVVLSTGHKSKGREWDSVFLESDFLAGIRTRDSDADKSMILPTASMEAELCLFYVACTRAMKELHVHAELDDKVKKLLRGQQTFHTKCAA